MVDTANLGKIWCYTMDGIFLGEAFPVQACHPLARLFGDQASVDQVIYQNKRQARLAKNTKKQLEALGVTKEAQDSLTILPFAKKMEKTAILPDAVQNDSVPGKTIPAQLPEKEVKRLEQIMHKAEQETEIQPQIPRPKYWSSDLEHYEWVFRLIHEHGQEPEKTDKAFMKSFESQPEFDSYRQRFEDLKLVYNLN